MRAVRSTLHALALVLVSLALASAAPARERTEIDDRYKWKVTDVYPSEEAWQAAKEALAERIPDLHRYEGTLGDSPGALYAALAARVEVDRALSRLETYAYMRGDEDTRMLADLTGGL